MKKTTLSTLSALAILIGVVYAPGALAQAPEWTTWSISEPTQVGDVVLQPGTYRLTVMRTPTSRNFIRVTNEDGTNLFTTALTVPHVFEPTEERPEAATFVYWPAVEGEPRVLRTWFAAAPPGAIGHDFVYEEDMAMRLARANEAQVIAYRGEIDDDVELEVVTPDARIETYTVPQTTIVEERTTTTITEQPTMVAEVRTERETLPATASSTPLLALLGLVSIGGAFAFRAMNR